MKHHLHRFCFLLCVGLAGCASPQPDSNTGSELAAYEPTLLKAKPTTQVPLINGGNRQWLVQASVNGVPGVFAVDTGADYTVLTPQFAEKAGLMDKSTKGWLIDEERKERVRFVKITRFALGDFDYVAFHAPILNLDHINRAMRSELAGILGNNLLRQTAVTLDWGKNSMTLDSRDLQTPAEAIPITLRGNRIYFAAAINGQTAEFALDTGAYRSLLSEAEVSRLQIPADKKRPFNALQIDILESRRVKQTEVTLDGFKLGRIQRENYPILTWKQNVLGMDLLQPWVLIIDARSHWMHLGEPEAAR